MNPLRQLSTAISTCRTPSAGTTAARIMASIFVLIVLFAQFLPAQTFTVLHNLSTSQGVNPVAGLSMDRAGNLYGTASGGGNFGGTCGNFGCGTVFKLTRAGSGWILNVLHAFTGGADGAGPYARVVFGPNGILYGTTAAGGQGVQATVFSIRPPASPCLTALCPWSETVLYRFTGGADGNTPNYGDVVFDQAGNLYGVTLKGGAYNLGVVYELTHSGGGWTETVMHDFAGNGQGNNDGSSPYGGLVIDNSGKLYGTTQSGGANSYGAVYRLTPVGAGWTEDILHSFDFATEGGLPWGAPVLDASGNLLGATSSFGLDGGGTLFELTSTGGLWSFSVPYAFAGNGSEYQGPLAALTMDAAGNLYGTTLYNGAYAHGTVFKLTPSNGGWTYTDLHDFTGGDDGEYPYSNVILDASGNLYGTAQGGTTGAGLIWEIAQ